MVPIEKEIVKAAYEFLGEEEIRGNKGFKNSRFEDLMKAVGWKVGQAWCSYFVELVWRWAYSQQNSIIAAELEGLFSGGAVATFSAFEKSPDFETTRSPGVGSVVIWQYYANGVARWQGHAGIVIRVHENYFETIEGNTNDDGVREGYEVALRLRKYNYNTQDGLRIKGFIKPKQP
jgi:hypothetical protein